MDVRAFQLTSEAMQSIEAFLPSVRTRTFAYLPPHVVEGVEAIRMAQVQDILGEPDVCVFAAQDDGAIGALAIAADLPWESEVFKRKCAGIREVLVAAWPDRGMVVELLTATLEFLKSRGVEFVSCKTDTSNVGLVQALQLSGFVLMDTLLEYVYDSSDPPFESVRPPAVDTNLRIRQAGPNDRPELIAIAERAFETHFGRFHADPVIPHSLAVDVYRRWADAAAKGFCNWIWVAEEGNRLAGFSAWKKPSALEERLSLGVGHYSIGAIDPDFHGRGLFQALTYAGMKELYNQGYRYIDGPTHINNYPVQRGYTNLGWKIANARHSFHIWL